MQGLVVGRGQSLKTKRYNTYRVDRQVFRFTELDDLGESNASKSVCSDLTRTFFPQWLWVWPQKVMRPTMGLAVCGIVCCLWKTPMGKCADEPHPRFRGDAGLGASKPSPDLQTDGVFSFDVIQRLLLPSRQINIAFGGK